MAIAVARRAGPGNVVVLSGDVHIGLAIELTLDPFDPAQAPIAVEFVNASLTSQNLDDKLGWTPRKESLEIEAALREALPHIKWCDLDSHGYNVVDVTPDRLQAEWWAVDTVLRPSRAETRVGAWQVDSGAPRVRPPGDWLSDSLGRPAPAWPMPGSSGRRTASPPK